MLIFIKIENTEIIYLNDIKTTWTFYQTFLIFTDEIDLLQFHYSIIA